MAFTSGTMWYLEELEQRFLKRRRRVHGLSPGGLQCWEIQVISSIQQRWLRSNSRSVETRVWPWRPMEWVFDRAVSNEGLSSCAQVKSERPENWLHVAVYHSHGKLWKNIGHLLSTPDGYWGVVTRQHITWSGLCKHKVLFKLFFIKGDGGDTIFCFINREVAIGICGESRLWNGNIFWDSALPRFLEVNCVCST